MFHSTMELFTLATSNSLLVFGLCNLIIVILLFSGLKPDSLSTQENIVCSCDAPKRTKKEEKERHEALSSENIEEASFPAKVPAVEDDEKPPIDKFVTIVDVEECDNEDEDDEDDDELRRRVEEFIEKINRGWKAEQALASQRNRSPSY